MKRCSSFDVHGCTDVSGFGFLGHAREMALASGVTLEIETAAHPSASRRAGCRPRRSRARWTQKQSRVRILRRRCEAENIDPLLLDLLYDPQTSGGLLISLSEADAAGLARASSRPPRRVGRVWSRETISRYFLK